MFECYRLNSQDYGKEMAGSPSIAIIPEPVSLIITPNRYYQVRERSLFTNYLETQVITTNSTEFYKPLYDIGIELFQVPDPLLGKEGYYLSIDSLGVNIKANTNEGVFYGLHTLRQIVMQLSDPSENALILPHLIATDYPAFPWRGMLLDCCRHFMEKDFILNYIDLLSFYKMNVFHWHLTEDQGWRIEIDKYPLLTEVGAWRKEANEAKYGGYYTKDDIREVVAYAAARNITVVPEIEMPGHAMAALAAYPELSCTGGPFEVATTWGVFKDIYCAGNDSVFVFLKDILDEVIELFPSEYIHIGGDEAPKFRWENCTRCQKRIADNHLKNEHELQSWFIDQIAAYLKSKNRKLIGWEEIIDGGLAEGVVVQSWKGFDGAYHAATNGNDAIVSPVSHAYFDYPVQKLTLEKVYQFDPIPKELDSAVHHHILGGECNMWTERAPQHLVDQKVFPRLLAMAEVLWSYPEMKDTLLSVSETYKNNIPMREYEPFRTRVRRHYPILKSMGVDYGLEEGGLSFSTSHTHEGIMVKMIREQENISILYGTGSDIGSHNLLYTEPIVVKDSLTINAAAYIDGKRVSEIFTRRFKLHDGLGLPYTLSLKPGSTYNKNPNTTLTDGIRGTTDFHDGLWLGFWEKDVSIRFKFHEPRNVSYLIIGCMQSNPSWIFLPEEVQVTIKPKGFLRKKIRYITSTTTQKETLSILEDFAIKAEKPILTKWIRINLKNPGKCPDWHPGAGSPTWLFIDEIEIQ